MKMPKCPLCQSEKIELKCIQKYKGNEGGINQTSVRLFCPKCKKGMTVTGILVYTAEEVEK